jgi:thiol-disulfide isomerase/thioredoxin
MRLWRRARWTVPSGRLVALLAVGLALAAVAMVARLRAVGPDRVPWRDPSAAAAGKPELLDFTADWCPACQDMKRDTWPDPSVAAAVSAAGCVPVRVDVDAHPELGSRYRVEYLPTLVMTDGQGRELRRIDGYLSPVDLCRWLAGGG